MTAEIKVSSVILRHINFSRPVCVGFLIFCWVFLLLVGWFGVFFSLFGLVFLIMAQMPRSAGKNSGWLETSVQVRQLPFKLSQQHGDVHKQQSNQICQSPTFTEDFGLDWALGSDLQIHAKLYNHVHLHRCVIAQQPQEQKFWATVFLKQCREFIIGTDCLNSGKFFYHKTIFSHVLLNCNARQVVGLQQATILHQSKG